MGTPGSGDAHAKGICDLWGCGGRVGSLAGPWVTLPSYLISVVVAEGVPLNFWVLSHPTLPEFTGPAFFFANDLQVWGSLHNTHIVYFKELFSKARAASRKPSLLHLPPPLSLVGPLG